MEGVLTSEELEENRADQATDTAKWKFRDDDYYLSKDFNLADIRVPILSAANWVSDERPDDDRAAQVLTTTNYYRAAFTCTCEAMSWDTLEQLPSSSI